MRTLSIRDAVRNAAAGFCGAYGAVTGRARQAGCSRQAVHDHARLIERRLPLADPATSTAAVPTPAPAPAVFLDEPARRRLAVTALATGTSTRQIEDLLRGLPPDDGPDHSTVARRIKDEAEKAGRLLETLDAGRIPRVRTLAIDEIFFGGGRPSSTSSRRA